MKNLQLRSLTVAFMTFLMVSIGGCEKKPTTEPTEIQTQFPETRPETPLFVASLEDSLAFFQQGEDALALAIQSAEQLALSTQTFLSNPSEATLEETQLLWLESVMDYRRFTLWRHLGLVAPSTFTRLNRLDYQISGYPIQPGFLDKFGEYQFSGLVNDISFPITKENLIHRHGITDLSEVVLGYHAIEFMLFNTDGARMPSDFQVVTEINAKLRERGFEDVKELPRNRRRDLLYHQTTLLIEDLKQLHNIWRGEVDSVVSRWQSLGDEEESHTTLKLFESGLTEILIELGELAQKKSETLKVSPQIMQQSFVFKQRYMRESLRSIQAGTLILDESIKTQIAESIAEAIHLTEQTDLSEEVSESDHWNEVFAKIKVASDALNLSNSN